MMPCGLAKSAPLQHNNASAAIGQQLISSNNSSFSLVQQLTSSNVHNSNVNIPHHFSTISSSGSLVIQQISNQTVPSPLLNHVNNSLLISAEAAATQSILNAAAAAQQPQYVPNNASFLFNAQHLTSSTSSSSSSLSSSSSSSSSSSALPSVMPENVSTYADCGNNSTPSSTSFIISTSCGANRNDIGTAITLSTSGSNGIPVASAHGILSSLDSCSNINNNNNNAAATLSSQCNKIAATVANASVDGSAAIGAASNDHGSACTSTLTGNGNGSHDNPPPSSSSMTDEHQQITLIKATSADESWSSVQDAGNQTETNEADMDGCCYDTEDKKSVESDDSSEESNRLKIDPDRGDVTSCESDAEEQDERDTRNDSYQKEIVVGSPAAAERSSKTAAETPDFSGLQLLLNGIEQVEHVRDTSTSTTNTIVVAEQTVRQAVGVASSTRTSAVCDDEDKPISAAQPTNGLEILCALADQRFYEENEDDKKGCGRATAGAASRKKSTLKRKRDSSDEDKFSSYRYKNDDSPILKSSGSNSSCGSRLFDLKHEISISPSGGKELQMRLELAELQKQYRETRKVLDRLTHGKYATTTVSSSSTRSPTPLKDVATTTVGSEPDCDSKPIATPVKRRPGRPRKYSDPSLTADKSTLSSSLSTSLPRSSACKPSSSMRPKPKLKIEAIADSSPDKTPGNGDLSPPVLEPMCSSSPKATKPFKSAVLSPPTLLPSKKSQRLKSPLYLRAKRSFVPRDALDAFSSSEPEENDEDNIDSEEENYDRTRRNVYSSDALKVKKNFYKGGYLEENGKETTLGLNRPLPEKRKVGRPRKYPKIEPNNQTTTTETNNCKTQNKGTLRYLTGVSKFSEYISSAMLESQRKPIHSSQYYDKECKPRITPKLKAEAKLKTWRQESPSPEANSPNDSIDCPFTFSTSTVSRKNSSNSIAKKSKNILASDDEEEEEETVYRVSRTPLHRPTARVSSNCTSTASKSVTNLSANSASGAVSSTTPKTVSAAASTTTTINEGDFRITAELLEDMETKPLRVLIPDGSAFKVGELSAIRAPDLYGIKLDGDRCHRTDIYTKEEVLRDVLLEVEGKYPLKNGTRVCAVWSARHSVWYPGYVTSFSSSEESEDENLTSVEFDDGDRRRFKIKDIRLLPKNLSFSRRTFPDDSNTRTQYHTNHDHHKRKRRISGVSFDEIPVDKQLHSSKSPSSSPEGTVQDEESSESRRISLTGSSARKSFTEYEDTGSRSSSFDQNEPESRSNFEPSTTSGDEVTATKIHRLQNDNQENHHETDCKNAPPQKKHLKKKRKDKLRAKDSASSSFKRKSHKCGDYDHDADSRKLHKRHKHKHKHRKHHKRKRSSSESERKYVSEDVVDGISTTTTKRSTDDEREINIDKDSDRITSLFEADCSSKDSCYRKSNMIDDGSGTDVKDQIISTIKNEENHPQNDGASSKYGASNLVDLKQSKSREEDDDKVPNSTSAELNSSQQTKPVNRKTVRPQSTATVQRAVTISDKEPIAVRDVKKEENLEKEEKHVDDDEKQQQQQQQHDDEEEEDSSEDSQDSQDEANSGDNFWEWCGKGFKRNGKGRAKKEFFQAIKRGDVEIRVGDCAVFLTADNSPKPFIGRIKSMWESYGNMMVLVKWFYHPEETSGLKEKLPFLGALFESPHDDKNDVQTISHKCEVVSIKEYRERLKKEPERLHNVYQSNDLYYLAGYYDPTNKRLTLEKDVVS